MPNQGSIADHLDNWDKLIVNVGVNSEELPDLAPYSGPLDVVLDQAKALNARLQSRRGVKQQESLDLRELLRTGRSLAAKLRSALRAFYGFGSERLLEYGIRPIRSHRRPPEEPEQPPPPPETPQLQGTAETAQAPKSEGPAPAPEKAASQGS